MVIVGREARVHGYFRGIATKSTDILLDPSHRLSLCNEMCHDDLSITNRSHSTHDLAFPGFLLRRLWLLERRGIPKLIVFVNHYLYLISIMGSHLWRWKVFRTCWHPMKFAWNSPIIHAHIDCRNIQVDCCIDDDRSIVAETQLVLTYVLKLKHTDLLVPPVS